MRKWQRLWAWLRGEALSGFFDWQPLCFVPERRPESGVRSR